MTTDNKPALTIEYCVPCGYLPRATWLAQELMAPFAESVSGITLVPGVKGVFDVKVNNEVVFSTRAEKRFPEIEELIRSIEARTGLESGYTG